MTEETGSDLSQTLLDVDHYTAYKNHRSILQHMVDMGYLLRSSTFSSGHYTSLEAEWMDDMRRVYEVYETYTPRSTVPNPNLPSPRLPWEICLHVVDYISDYKGKDERDRSDKEMLWSCCLTCRTFVGPGRRYLYKYVELDSYWILKSFIDIIKRNSHLQRLTTHLDLMTYEVEAYHYLFLHHQALSNLAKLTLHKMPMLNPRLLLDQRHPFHSVTDLDLSDCGFSSVLDLRRMIGNFFPNLSYLSLSNLLLGSSHVNLPNKWPRNVISLSELNIASILGDYGPITEWLASTPSQTSICNLHISPNQTRMLLSFGQGIEELEITSMSIAGEYDLDQAISLGPHLLPQLKTLHVYFRSDSDMAQFCTMISRCHPSATLRTLRLNFHSEISTDAYSLLDGTLSTILLPYTCIVIDVERWESLPKLKKKGMLVLRIELNVTRYCDCEVTVTVIFDLSNSDD